MLLSSVCFCTDWFVLDRGCAEPDDIASDDATEASISVEWQFTIDCFNIALRRHGDNNVLPLISVMLVFFWALSSTPQGADFLSRFIPWELVADFVNALTESLNYDTSIDLLHYSMLSKTEEEPPLPEDYPLRGQVYCNGLFPPMYFAKAPVDVDERFLEQPAFTKRRTHRIKWLAGRIAMAQQNSRRVNRLALPECSAESTGLENPANPEEVQTISGSTRRRWLRYNKESDRFSVIRWHQ